MSDQIATRLPFEFTLELEAPAHEVWKALCTAEELARWFPLEARVKPGLGGSIFLSWGPECQGEGPITAWEVNRHLQWREKLPAPGSDQAPAVPISVDFFLEARGGKTVLRLVHSGFGKEASWDGYYDSISRGWKFELRGLRHYLRHHRGKDRRVVWVRQRTRHSPEETARRVIGPEGQVLRGRLTGLQEGDLYRLDSVGETGRSFEGLVQVNGLPFSFAATVVNLAESYLRFEVEHYAGGLEAWVWLSTWGVGDDVREGLRQRWSEDLAKALAD